ncbi:MAG: ATP-binding region, ATPase domain protein, partial [Nocardioides sp.]|nr:ATP-binding region, ATPase domain protein [Nocardioides sp.]
MRRRISWLVVATTSMVVVSFVIPLCLLVRTLAEDRAIAAADQEARNVAILVAGLAHDPQLAELVDSIDRRGTPTTQVLTPDRRVLGDGPPMKSDPEVRRARAGEAFTVVDGDGGRVLIPVVLDDGTAVVRTTVTRDDLRRGVAPAWAGIIGLGVVLFLLALALAYRAGRRISEPLLEVAATAHRLR